MTFTDDTLAKLEEGPMNEICKLVEKAANQLKKLQFETMDEPPLRLRLAIRYIANARRRLGDSQKLWAQKPVCEKCGRKI